MRIHPLFLSAVILAMGLVSCSKSTTHTNVEVDPVLLIPPIDQLYSGALPNNLALGAVGFGCVL